MFQFRMENVHFAAILKDDFIIELRKGLRGRVRMDVLDEGFPDFGFFEDEYFDNFTKRIEELIEIVVSDNIAISIVDANQKDRSLI